MFLPLHGLYCVSVVSLVLLSLSLAPYRMMCVSSILPPPRRKKIQRIHWFVFILKMNFYVKMSKGKGLCISGCEKAFVDGQRQHYKANDRLPGLLAGLFVSGPQTMILFLLCPQMHTKTHSLPQIIILFDTH